MKSARFLNAFLILPIRAQLCPCRRRKSDHRASVGSVRCHMSTELLLTRQDACFHPQDYLIPYFSTNSQS